MGNIPRDPKQCVHCIQNGEPCVDHRGPTGSPVEYTGPDMYEPDDWVKEVMTTFWRAYSTQDNSNVRGHICSCIRSWECFGFDPRVGFWMRTIDRLGPPRQTNISVRAIDATWHSAGRRA